MKTIAKLFLLFCVANISYASVVITNPQAPASEANARQNPTIELTAPEDYDKQIEQHTQQQSSMDDAQADRSPTSSAEPTHNTVRSAPRTPAPTPQRKKQTPEDETGAWGIHY